MLSPNSAWMNHDVLFNDPIAVPKSLHWPKHLRVTRNAFEISFERVDFLQLKSGLLKERPSVSGAYDRCRLLERPNVVLLGGRQSVLRGGASENHPGVDVDLGKSRDIVFQKCLDLLCLHTDSIDG